jgi:predicted RecB family nuclease
LNCVRNNKCNGFILENALMNQVRTISKSSYIRGNQCQKSLYLHFHEPSLKDEVSEGQQHIFNIGHNTGKLAQELFPGGIDASRGQPHEVSEAIAYTKQLIETGQSVIYEAAFSDGETLCYIDLLVNREGEWHAFEVKASTGVKDYHLLDIAFQYYAIRQSGLQLKEISLVHLNNQYVRRGEIDVDQLFTIVSLTDQASGMKALVHKNLQAMQNMLALGKVPDIKTGSHCKNPFTCDFYGYCHKDEKSDLFTGLTGIRAFKIERLRSSNVSSFAEIPSNLAFSTKEWTILKGLFKNEKQLDVARLKSFVEKLKYPLHFLDFETIMPAVPLYDESRPYQQLPFQYSLHKKMRPDSKLIHISFLGNPPEDPRPAFIKTLMAQIEEEGSIIVYNKAFEQTRIRELSRDFPIFAESLLNLNKRMADLMEPFRNQLLYLPGMKGSYSIKMVLPALAPEITYDDLEIREGNTASLIYYSLYDDKDQTSIINKRENLLKYCEMDTMAMVHLLEVINKHIA